MANETAELEAMKSGELGAVQSDDGEPDQLALFAEELDDAAAQSFGDAPKRRGPGRPSGARNRATAETIRLIQAMGADPLTGAANIVRGGPGYVLASSIKAEAEAYGIEKYDDQGRPLAPIYDKDGNLIGHELWRASMSMKDAWAVRDRNADMLNRVMHSAAPARIEVSSPQGLAVVLPAQPDPSQLAAPYLDGTAEDDGSNHRAPLLPGPDNSSTYASAQGEVTQANSHTDGESDD